MNNRSVERVLFATVDVGDGAFGVTEADNLCKEFANSNGVSGGGFRAVLGIAGERDPSLADTWVLGPRIAYFRAADFAFITTTDSGGRFVPEVGAWGASPGGAGEIVWTGLGIDGNVDALHNCSGFTSQLSDGAIGRAANVGVPAFSAGLSLCVQARPFLCVATP